jgi:hypothetical protein
MSAVPNSHPENLKFTQKEKNKVMKPELTMTDPEATFLGVPSLSPIRHRALTILVGGGSPVHRVISKSYLNKQANSFSRKESKVLKP